MKLLKIQTYFNEKFNNQNKSYTLMFFQQIHLIYSSFDEINCNFYFLIHHT
jgi:hypothetical protein